MYTEHVKDDNGSNFGHALVSVWSQAKLGSLHNGSVQRNRQIQNGILFLCHARCIGYALRKYPAIFAILQAGHSSNLVDRYLYF